MIRHLLLSLILLTGMFNAMGQTPPDKLGEPLVAYLLNDEWHVLDHSGKEMFKPLPKAQVPYIFGYGEGLFAAKAVSPEGELKSVFFNEKAEIVIVNDADVVDPFYNGMALTAMKVDNEDIPYKAGFINKRGEQVLPMEYVDFTPFENGLAYLMDSLAKKGWRGYVDTSGKRVINLPKNVVGYKFSEGIAAVADTAANVGYIDTYGQYVLPVRFDSPGEFSEGMIATSDNGFLGYVDIRTKEFAIDPAFDDARPFHEGRAWVGTLTRSGGLKYALIDKEGNYLKNFMFDFVSDFSEGFGTVALDGKFMFVDKEGELPIGQLFSYCSSFKNGLAWAAIKEDGKAGFIDYEGDYQIELPLAEKYIDLRTNQELGLAAVIDAQPMENATTE